MALLATFHGGPADGTVRSYRYHTVLPSLYFKDQDRRIGAIYELASCTRDPETGAWPYRLVKVEPDIAE